MHQKVKAAMKYKIINEELIKIRSSETCLYPTVEWSPHFDTL